MRQIENHADTLQQPLFIEREDKLMIVPRMLGRPRTNDHIMHRLHQRPIAADRIERFGGEQDRPAEAGDGKRRALQEDASGEVDFAHTPFGIAQWPPSRYLRESRAEASSSPAIRSVTGSK